jgi:hypothetical protein
MSKQGHLADVKMAFHLFHVIIQQMFIEQLLCTGHGPKGWEHSYKQNIKILASQHLYPRSQVDSNK